jgi:hypothetical protein
MWCQGAHRRRDLEEEAGEHRNAHVGQHEEIEKRILGSGRPPISVAGWHAQSAMPAQIHKGTMNAMTETVAKSDAFALMSRSTSIGRRMPRDRARIGSPDR